MQFSDSTFLTHHPFPSKQGKGVVVLSRNFRKYGLGMMRREHGELIRTGRTLVLVARSN